MNKISKVIRIFLNTLVHFSYLITIVRDVFSIRNKAQTDKIHLEAAMAWLCRSQDIEEGGGCSGIYTYERAWTEPYPETTGYIIPTMLKYGELTNNSEYFDRARRMGDWEIEIQLKSGAVRGGVGINEYPIVFNTGQVMFGWNALYRKTGEKKYLDAAIRAAEWLVGNMDEDGKWSKNTFQGIPHAYNVRVTWALLSTGILSKNDTFIAAATKNLNWVLSMSNEKGWIKHMEFYSNRAPFTHTIAYTLRGLLECSLLLEGEISTQIQKLVIQASETIKDKYYYYNAQGKKPKGLLPGKFDSNWESQDTFSCLTGNAQMAIIWLKLFSLTKNEEFKKVAIENIEQLKSLQNLTTKNKGINGAIAGSYPIWGEYVNFAYPNWASKFFVDAILLKWEIENPQR